MNSKMLLLIALLLIAGASAISADVQITPSIATTTNTLGCLVNASATGTLSANITWYQNSAAHTSDDETIQLSSGTQNSTSAQGDIEPSDTARDDVWICQATIANGTNTTVLNSSSITIENAAPIVTYPTSAQTLTEGVAVAMTATATDPDGDAIVTWISNDLNSSEYSGNDLFSIGSDGSISFTPTYAQRGNHTMVLSASDGDVLGGKTVLFTVEIVNQEPRFSPSLSDKNAQGSQEWTYNITGSDRESDEFNFTLVSSDLATVQLNETSSTTAQLFLTTGSPRYEDRGLHNITVAVYNPTNNSQNTTETFTLNITAQNDVPVLGSVNAPNATQGEQLNFTVNASDINLNDTLFFTIDSTCDIDNPWNITTLNSSASNGTGRVSETLTNDHVACREVVVTVFDIENSTIKDNDTQTFTLNVTNTNDAPIIYDNSTQPSTYGEYNLTGLTAAQGLPFTYTVRAEDPDELTYESETITYSDNTSLFAIDSLTGEISFTPQISDVGIHQIEVNVSDDQGLSDVKTLTLNITGNDAPVLAALPALSCQEDAVCNATLSASDDDLNENLTFSAEVRSVQTASNQSVNTTLNITQQAYDESLLEKVFGNLHVGNYTYNITVTDRWGANDSGTLSISVTNTNDAPFFDSDQDSVADSVSIPGPVVENYTTSFTVPVTDEDLANGQDNLTLTVTLQGPDTNLFSPQKVDENTFLISFTPSASELGDYNATFDIRDAAGAGYNETVSFTVVNASEEPVITHAAPYYNSTLNATTYNLSATNGSNSTNITLTEPNSVTFNITVNDSDSAQSNLSIEWFKNGVSLKNSTADANYAYTETLGYHAQGNYTYSVTVTDERFSNTTFTWNTEVLNINRNPQLVENLTGRNVTQQLTISEEMDAFYDPDDDLDDNSSIDASETSTLTYSANISDEDVLQANFSSTDLILTPLANGTVNVTYTATDPYGAQVDSNTVTYDVTAPPEEEDEDESQSNSGSGGSSGGGSGGSSSVPVPIPISRDTEPEAIQIIVPEPLTIAYNQTIAAPLSITNTGERTLRTVTLAAETEAQNVTMRFTESEIASIEPGEEHNVTLFVTNFRTDGTYEIMVSANSEQPDVNDTAIIFVNSLEQTSEGAAVQTRITFARDLLSSNPECLELNELLSQATRAVQTNQLEEAGRLINAAVDGCRYLISESNRREETPGLIGLDWLLASRYANHILIGALIVVTLIGGFLAAHYITAAKKS